MARRSSMLRWRMPYSTRTYPMKLEEKAAHYRRLMQAVGILKD